MPPPPALASCTRYTPIPSGFPVGPTPTLALHAPRNRSALYPKAQEQERQQQERPGTQKYGRNALLAIPVSTAPSQLSQ
jgi:hypothetical protein